MWVYIRSRVVGPDSVYCLTISKVGRLKHHLNAIAIEDPGTRSCDIALDGTLETLMRLQVWDQIAFPPVREFIDILQMLGTRKHHISAW